MVEITLKRQARDFADRYDVSYTRALAGVDEPLHRLRDELLNRKRHQRAGFELTDSAEDLLTVDPSADSETEAHFTQRIRGTEIRPYLRNRKAEEKVLSELARRTEILEGSKAPNIWHQRQLYRAGLVAETLEPLPIYYRRFGRVQDLIRDWDGDRLGLIEVAVLQDDMRELHSRNEELVARGQIGAFRMKKLTLTEFQELLQPSMG